MASSGAAPSGTSSGPTKDPGDRDYLQGYFDDQVKKGGRSEQQ